MADRQVTATGKDRDTEITKLCNVGQAWSPRSKADAIRDIDDRVHTYFVRWPEGHRTEIRVVKGAHGPYLRTDRDETTRNNLADLADC